MGNERSQTKGGCPVLRFDIESARPGFEFFEELDAVRDQSPIFWNDYGSHGGFWSVMGYEQILELQRDYETFSNETFDPLDPKPGYRFIPNHLSPPDHGKYRGLVNNWMSPRNITGREPGMRAAARKFVKELHARGGCEFSDDFAMPYTGENFFSVILGFEKGEEDEAFILEQIKLWFSGLSGTDKSITVQAVQAINEYYADVLARRRQSPRDPSTDFISYLMNSKVDDAQLSDRDILDFTITLTSGGLDSTAGTLAAIFYNLATHPADRARMVSDPKLMPRAMEETMRVSSGIAFSARTCTRDTDFHGAQMKAGDVVSYSPTAGNRDPKVYDDPNSFVIDRRGRPHLTLGSGIHQCAGAHFARRQMAIALEEWHAVIPEYNIAADAEISLRGRIPTPNHLPLQW